MAVLGLFYYLRVLKAAYMDDAGDLRAPQTPAALNLAIALCLLAVVGIGIYPGPALDASVAAARDLLDASVTTPRVAAIASPDSTNRFVR